MTIPEIIEQSKEIRRILDKLIYNTQSATGASTDI